MLTVLNLCSFCKWIMKRLAYFYPLLWLLSLLPFSLLLHLKSSYLCQLYCMFWLPQKWWNLRLVFPEKTKQRFPKLPNNFTATNDVVLKPSKATISEQTLRKRFTFKNLEVLGKAAKEAKAYCSCNIATMPVRSGHPGTANALQRLCRVYKNWTTLFWPLGKKIRGKYGASIINNKQIAKVLRKVSNKANKASRSSSPTKPPNPGPTRKNNPLWASTCRCLWVPRNWQTLGLRRSLPKDWKRWKCGHYEAAFVYPWQHTLKTYRIIKLREGSWTKSKTNHDQPQYYLWSHKRWKHRHLSSNQEASNKASWLGFVVRW